MSGPSAVIKSRLADKSLDSGLSWLMCTTYISNDFNSAPIRSTDTGSKQAAAPAGSKQDTGPHNIDEMVHPCSLSAPPSPALDPPGPDMLQAEAFTPPRLLPPLPSPVCLSSPPPPLRSPRHPSDSPCFPCFALCIPALCLPFSCLPSSRVRLCCPGAGTPTALTRKPFLLNLFNRLLQSRTASGRLRSSPGIQPTPYGGQSKSFPCFRIFGAGPMTTCWSILTMTPHKTTTVSRGSTQTSAR